MGQELWVIVQETVILLALKLFVIAEVKLPAKGKRSDGIIWLHTHATRR